MAGMLPKNPSSFLKIKGAKLAIIASQWHSEIIGRMITSSVTQLKNLEVFDNDIEVFWSPGSLEIPLYASQVLGKNGNLDGIICFGVVLRGDTTHDQTVLTSVSSGLLQISLKYSKPIINEVIGVKTLEDAEVRAVDKGIEAVFAMSEAINFLRSYK